MNILSKAKKEILLGNEGVVRGALEYGVDFVATYPGTPASEIGNSFYLIKKQETPISQGFYFEYSSNEKVAMEAGVGASFSGLKTLVAMKHFGLNVAQEALLPFLYTGSKGPTVIAVSDDPSCHSSAQSEQNSRAVAHLAHIPTLEPADPEEAKEFTKTAFKLSDKLDIPVMVRLTTRVSHQRAPVELGRISVGGKQKKGEFVKDKRRFITMPPRVLEMKDELLDKLERAKKISEKSKLNRIEGPEKEVGVIASGVSYLYVKEALDVLKLRLPILKIGIFYPLPEQKIRRFIEQKKRIIVVEELEPWIEKEVERLAKKSNPGVEIHGKNLLPMTGELNPGLVVKALIKVTGEKLRMPEPDKTVSVKKRGARPCPGCPYWITFGAVKQVADENKVVFGGDIGCYMMAGIPSLGLQDYLSCMGSSLGIAHGIKKADPEQKLIAFIGDSTFFHAGMPALANIVFNESNPLIIVMDNSITAMTGQQPNPGEKIEIEEVVRALGVENVKTVDPLKEREVLKETIKEFLEKDKVSVIIARSPCLFIR